MHCLPKGYLPLGTGLEVTEISSGSETSGITGSLSLSLSILFLGKDFQLCLYPTGLLHYLAFGPIFWHFSSW